MSSQISRLISRSSDPLGPRLELISNILPSIVPETLLREFVAILRQRNGFYAFESALLFRPFESEKAPLGVREWNQPDLWKASYAVDLNDTIFFAEDVFGIQFYLFHGGVGTFDPETGEMKHLGKTLEDWAAWLLSDPRQTTGWPFAHFWQLRNGTLTPGTRLLPKKPFVLGGQFAQENFYAQKDVEGMCFRATIANQIKDCPDGSKVILKLTSPDVQG